MENLDGSPYQLPFICVAKGSKLSTTDVNLVSYLVGKTRFTAWDDFHKEAEKCLHEILRMPAEMQEDAISFITAVRRQVQPSKMSTDWVNRIPIEKYFGDFEGSDMEKRDIIGTGEPVFSDELSMLSIFSNSLNAVGNLVQRLSGSYALSMTSKGLVLPSHLSQRVKDCDVDYGVPVTPKSRKERKKYVLPDWTLMFLHDETNITGDPICSFEVKGPTKNITGRGIVRGEKEKSKGARKGEQGWRYNFPEVIEDNTAKLVRRLNHIFVSDDPNEELSPDPPSTNTITGSTVYPEQTTERRRGSLRTIISRSRQDVEHKEEQSGDYAAQKPIAQALVYALLTKSGCSYLWNYGDGVALEVSKGRGKYLLDVRAALVRPDKGDRVGHIASEVYLCLHALKRTVDEQEQLWNDLQSIVDELKPPPGDENDKDRDGHAGGGADKRGEYDRDDQGRNDEDEPDGRRSTKRQRMYFEKSAKTSGTQRAEKRAYRGCLSPRFSDIEDHKTESWDSGVSFFGDGRLGRHEIRALWRSVQKNPFANGRSGEIYQGVWKGVRIILKVWNMELEEGLAELGNEIAVLREMQRNFPGIMGFAVPRVLFYWNGLHDLKISERKVGLVMEFVGKEILEDEEGNLCVMEEDGPRFVTKEEAKEIGKAAMKSLSAIHNAGFYHGDIALRNLRVEKVSEQTADWRAWWIDFGQSGRITDKNKAMSVSETRACRSVMYNTAL